MQFEKIYAVIPAYNVARNLEEVILKLQTTLPEIQIVVVNDGSDDETQTIIKKLPVMALQNQENQGKGAALKKGFKKALANDAEVVLTIDADGQHNPFRCPELLKKMKQDNLDLVIGNRMHDTAGMPIQRILSNKITSKLISWRIKQKILDSQSGFRLYRARLLKSVDTMSRHFDFESEILLKAALQGFQIGLVNIDTIYRKENPSSMGAFDIIRFVRVYCRSFFWKNKVYGHPHQNV